MCVTFPLLFLSVIISGNSSPKIEKPNQKTALHFLSHSHFYFFFVPKLRSLLRRKMIGAMSTSPRVPSSFPPSSSPLSGTSSPPATSLPLRTIPGSYGLPLLGPISDRLDYFWFQGPETFFRKRMDKHKSPVFRTNMPPCWPFFIGVNPNVVALLDVKSFSHLFDMELVEKKNVLVGDFMPSVGFTGDIRTCAYLDPSEPQHAKVKNFTMDTLKRSSKVWVNELVSGLDTLFDTIETKLSEKKPVVYVLPLQKFLFSFLSKSLIGADPKSDSAVADHGHTMIDRWLALQLLPTVKIGVLQPLEEIFLHSFRYPSFLVSGAYKKLYNFVDNHGQEILKRAESEFGLSREDAIHNLVFTLGFNAFGGFSIFLPSLIGAIAGDEQLQQRLQKEVTEKFGTTPSNLSFNSVKELELVNSVVYETLRLNPPVPLQYARARKDFRLSSGDSLFEIKKGELLCGYQPLVMRDPTVFNEPDKFIGDRFTGEKGAELLNYLYWSNGPQTGSPTESNKQCAAKEFVPLTAAMVVAYVFQRYESISGGAASITAVKKRK